MQQTFLFQQCLCKDDQFTRTGSGQTRGKLRERGGFDSCRLNKAWASTERAMPYEQTDITQDVLPFDSAVGSGLLYIHPTALHGSSVLWTDDMSFRDPDYVEQNNAGAAPTVVVGYQSEQTCNITQTQGNYNVGECHHGGPGYRLVQGGASFASFRANQLWSDSAEPERKGLGAKNDCFLRAICQNRSIYLGTRVGNVDEKRWFPQVGARCSDCLPLRVKKLLSLSTPGLQTPPRFVRSWIS